jgi:uncharacterized membrane protein
MRSVEGQRAVERLGFFSDAVFAVALTLLVIHIPIPASYVTSDVLHDTLGDVVPQLIGFGLSFAVVGLLWLDHHQLFDYLRRRDEGLLLANLAFLLCIAFLPYPAGVLTKHLDAPVAVLFFIGSVVVTALVWLGLGWYASAGSRLVDESTGEDRRRVLRRSMTTPLVFALSAPLAPVIFEIGGDAFSLAIVVWIVALPAARIAAVHRRGGPL